jgi:hypothetical protein
MQYAKNKKRDVSVTASEPLNVHPIAAMLAVDSSDSSPVSEEELLKRFETPEQLLERFLSLSHGEQDREFYSIDKTAKRLRKGQDAIRRWVREGKVRYTLVGGTVYVWVPHLLSFLRVNLRRHV